MWDNAAMESFFSLLKTERLARTIYRTRDATPLSAISALWRSNAWPVQAKLSIHRTGCRPVVATALFDRLFHYASSCASRAPAAIRDAMSINNDH